MSWNYENHLKQIIKTAQENVGLSNFAIEVCVEQDFVKREFMAENTIYVVVKYLTPDVSFGATTQPVQLLILTEQNSLEATRLIFNNLVENNNFKSYSEETNYIKQQYSNPVVLSNFNEAAYGYRSVMYLSSTLYIMEGVSDIKNLHISLDVVVGTLIGSQITVKNDWFNGEYSGEVGYSPKYVVDTSLIDEPFGIGLIWEIDGASIIYVNDILCRKFVFDDEKVELFDEEDNNFETIYYSRSRYITIQFYGPENVEVVNSNFINYENYSQVFPDIVTQYEIIPGSNEVVEPLSFGLSYAMTPNTQQIPPKRIATSVKSVSTLAISMLVPFLSKYKFLKMITYMLNEQVSGNIDFILSFEVDGLQFTDLKMKLTSAQIVTAPNEVPSFKIGLIK